jgi:hypothetical protein
MSSGISYVSCKTMSLESVIENQLRQAIERGEFDDFKGKGQPLDLTAYFNTPEEMRMAYSMLKSNNFVPEEVELMNEIAALRTSLKDETDPVKRATLVKDLNEKSLSLNLALEKYRRKS